MTTTTHTNTTQFNPELDIRPTAEQASKSRAWSIAGLGAGIASLASIAGSSMAGAVYEDGVAGNPIAIASRLGELAPAIYLFHTTAMISALLLLVFAAGLHRQLRDRLSPHSILPVVAVNGLLLVSVAQLMGTALTTEFVMTGDGTFLPEVLAMWGHWMGTVSWLWAGAGATALAMVPATFRSRAYPRWIGVASLVLGGLTALLGISPLQYMAGLTGPLWLILISLGLTFSKNARRQRS